MSIDPYLGVDGLGQGLAVIDSEINEVVTCFTKNHTGHKKMAPYMFIFVSL